MAKTPKKGNEIILRARTTDIFPQVEYEIQNLLQEKIFRTLATQDRLTIEVVRSLPVSRFCEVFVRGYERLQANDFMIFPDGNVELFQN